MSKPRAILASYVGVLAYSAFIFLGAWRLRYWQGLLYVVVALVGGAAASEDYVASIKAYESDRIRLLDYVYGEELEELWSNAYLVVQPSTMEGLSIALLEALSYGRCVLLSDIPENLEVAEDCAVSFRSRDVGDLRAKLEMLLRDPALVRSFEGKAREHIRRHYSWERVAKNTESVYLRLLGGSARRP